jgi:gamma-aminobutyric acid receptor subunit beta
MSDIYYGWNSGLKSVEISNDVGLPEWKILGHRQRTIEASLTTGEIQKCRAKFPFFHPPALRILRKKII